MSTFTCNICDFIAVTSAGLKIHKNKKHVPEIDTRCIYCKKTISNKSNLKKHILVCKVRIQQEQAKNEALMLKEQVIKAKAEAEAAEEKARITEQIIQAKAEAQVAEVKARTAEEKLQLMNEAKNEMIEVNNKAKQEITDILKQQLEKAQTKQTKVVKNTMNNNITINTLEPITSERIFNDIKQYSNEATRTNKLPRDHADIMLFLYEQNPRSFVTTDSSRQILAWVDGDDKKNNNQIIHDKKGVQLSRKIHTTIVSSKEDPLLSLAQLIEDARRNISSEEDSQKVMKAYDTLQRLRTNDPKIYNNFCWGANNLIDVAPKFVEPLPQPKEELVPLMNEIYRTFITRPYKILGQTPEIVGQWIRNVFDTYKRAVINDSSVELYTNFKSSKESFTFNELFYNIRNRLSLLNSMSDELFTFVYMN